MAVAESGSGRPSVAQATASRPSGCLRFSPSQSWLLRQHRLSSGLRSREVCRDQRGYGLGHRRGQRPYIFLDAGRGDPGCRAAGRTAGGASATWAIHQAPPDLKGTGATAGVGPDGLVSSERFILAGTVAQRRVIVRQQCGAGDVAE